MQYLGIVQIRNNGRNPLDNGVSERLRVSLLKNCEFSFALSYNFQEGVTRLADISSLTRGPYHVLYTRMGFMHKLK